MSEIGAVVKVVDSHLCGWGSILGKCCYFLSLLEQELITVLHVCSDQHAKKILDASWVSIDYQFAIGCTQTHIE